MSGRLRNIPDGDIPPRVKSLTPNSIPLHLLPNAQNLQHGPPQQQHSQPHNPSIPNTASHSTKSAPPHPPLSLSSGPSSRGKSPDARHSGAGGPSKERSGNPLQPLLTAALTGAEYAVKVDSEMKFAEALQAYRNTIVAFEKVLAKADAVDAGLAAERRAAIIAARNAKLNPVDGADNTATSPPSRPKRKRPRRGPLRDTERKRLIELRDTYIKRVDILLSHLPPEFSAMYNAPTKSNSSTTLSRSTSLSRIRPSTTSSIPSTESTFESVLLEDPTIHEQPPTPPSDPTRHPFYLMRLLHQTMTVGGYLTPSLYVPRQLWFQSGARFVAIEAKLVACEQLLVYLTKLRQIGNTDVVTLQRELVEFESAVDGLRKDLTRKLRFIDEGVGSPLSATTMTPKASPLSPYPPDITSPVLPSSASILSTSSSTTSTNRFSTWSNKLSKSMEKLNIQRKTDRVLDSTSFIDLLVRLFEQSRVLADWLDALENGMLVGANPGLVQELVGRLGRISAFFGMVVVPFVLRDFEMLLERFLKKMRQVAVA